MISTTYEEVPRINIGDYDGMVLPVRRLVCWDGVINWTGLWAKLIIVEVYISEARISHFFRCSLLEDIAVSLRGPRLCGGRPIMRGMLRQCCTLWWGHWGSSE